MHSGSKSLHWEDYDYLWRSQSYRIPIQCIYLISYDQSSDLQAEKRGNFVVIGCVDGSRVISWSLNVS